MRVVILLLMTATSAFAQTPRLELTSKVEEGKKMLIATLTRDGKPVEGVMISFYVDRHFGRLLLGQDKTLDDGSAAVPAPEDLAAGPGGELKITAEAQLPEEPQAHTDVAMRTAPDEAPASPAPIPPRIIDAQFTTTGETKMLQEQGRQQRALWAPRAPVPLLTAVTGILVLVWGTYAFVVSQIIKIKQLGTYET